MIVLCGTDPNHDHKSKNTDKNARFRESHRRHKRHRILTFAFPERHPILREVHRATFIAEIPATSWRMETTKHAIELLRIRISNVGAINSRWCATWTLHRVRSYTYALKALLNERYLQQKPNWTTSHCLIIVAMELSGEFRYFWGYFVQNAKTSIFQAYFPSNISERSLVGGLNDWHQEYVGKNKTCPRYWPMTSALAKGSP